MLNISNLRSNPQVTHISRQISQNADSLNFLKFGSILSTFFRDLDLDWKSPDRRDGMWRGMDILTFQLLRVYDL